VTMGVGPGAEMRPIARRVQVIQVNQPAGDRARHQDGVEDTVGELEPSLSRSEFTGYASDIFPLGIRPERGLLRLAR